MLGRIIIIISLLALIGFFIFLFNLSLSSLEEDIYIEGAEELALTRAQRFHTSLTVQDREDFIKLPCKKRSKKDCPDIKKYYDLIKSKVNGGAIIFSTLLNNNGEVIFTGKKSDDKYRYLIRKLNNKKVSSINDFMFRNDAKIKFVASLIDLSKVTGDTYLSGINLLILSDKSKISVNKMPYHALLVIIFCIPIALIFLTVMRRDNKLSNKHKVLKEEVEHYKGHAERLKKENVQQGQFLANFTHELRTPLNSVIGFSGLLKDETLGPLGNPEYLKYSNDINHAGVHLLSLINDILDYSKAESGKLKVSNSEVDLVKVVKQCMAIIAPRASESKVELLQSFASKHIIVKIDSKRFKQILLNLLSNAVKFTPEDGSVTLSIFPDVKGDRIYVEVKDTGVGIDEKDIPTVMSLFGQVETDLNRKYEGTGIGLPFAKRLTNLMGGTFEISSKVNVGTRITLAFPFDKKLNIQFQDMNKKPEPGDEATKEKNSPESQSGI